MKKFFTYIISILLVFVLVNNDNCCFANHPKKTVAVITDTGHRNGTNYLICGAASDIIATDLVNRINMTGRMNAPLLGETMSSITQKNIPLFYMTFLNEYKYNYNIDFVNLKRVTKNINADYLLMVTSGLDVQSNFLKDTWWNKLNIAGMDPVRPTYKLSTLITLIDKKTYQIVWQDLYLRDIEANNYDLGIVQFSPSYAQLAKLKKYSKNVSEYVTNIVDKKVNPWIVPNKSDKPLFVKSVFINEGTKVYYPMVNGEVVKENVNEFATDTKQKWNNYKKQREQKKHIENVSNVEKNNAKKIKPAKKQKVKKDKQLFDSIRNNIDDVSNSLPEPAKTNNETVIKKDIQAEQPINQPIEIEKPAVYTIQEKNNTQQNIKPIKNIPVENKNQQQQQNQQPNIKKPYYDWNIKNIYLQKIGLL